LTLKEFF